MVESLRIRLHSLALLGLLLLAGQGSAAGADPANAAGGVAATTPSSTQGGFFSSLKQAFSQHTDREVVWAHFDVGAAPDSHRFYCLVDPKTGTREPNGVAGEPFIRRDGMTGLKTPAVSPVSCADAEQKGILVTSGYTVTASAGSAKGAVPAAAAPAPAVAAASGAAVAQAAAHPQGSDLRAELEAANEEWLSAYNTMNGAALGALYTQDATLLPPDDQPVTGATRIERFWTDQIKDGAFKNHTWTILSINRAGKYVIQVARYTVDMVKDGKTTRLEGNTIRVMQQQPDGKWLTAIHMYN